MMKTTSEWKLVLNRAGFALTPSYIKGITVATKKPETAGKTPNIRAECGENSKMCLHILVRVSLGLPNT